MAIPGQVVPCSNPNGCDGLMKFKISVGVPRDGVSSSEAIGIQQQGWVCDKCGYVDPSLLEPGRRPT
jgi:hypothetical protein